MTRRADEVNRWIARGFGRIEDFVYIGLAVILAASAIVLLVDGGIGFVRAVLDRDLGR